MTFAAPSCPIASLRTIREYLPLCKRIGSAGQPAPDQFAFICAAGYETVINLAPAAHRAAVANENEIVAGLGMEYVPIPVSWDAPCHQDLARFFDAMDAHVNRRVFVHCAANMRASAFLFLWRVARGGVDETDAEDDMERIWTPEGVWREFVEDALANGRRSRG